jgi:hypothetical protein
MLLMVGPHVRIVEISKEASHPHEKEVSDIVKADLRK